MNYEFKLADDDAPRVFYGTGSSLQHEVVGFPAREVICYIGYRDSTGDSPKQFFRSSTLELRFEKLRFPYSLL